MNEMKNRINNKLFLKLLLFVFLNYAKNSSLAFGNDC